jgi:hypothetical protein
MARPYFPIPHRGNARQNLPANSFRWLVGVGPWMRGHFSRERAMFIHVLPVVALMICAGCGRPPESVPTAPSTQRNAMMPRPEPEQKPKGNPGELHSQSLGLENGLHWCLDVIFREDGSRTRCGHAGTNLGLIRRVALALLKRTSTKDKHSTIPTRRMRAVWDDDYMLKVLQGITGISVREPCPAP